LKEVSGGIGQCWRQLEVNVLVLALLLSDIGWL